MTLDPFFRRMTMIAGVFAFMGVVLGCVALATNYWTMEYEFQPGMTMMMNNPNVTMRWNVRIVLYENLNIYFHINGILGFILPMYVR